MATSSSHRGGAPRGAEALQLHLECDFSAVRQAAMRLRNFLKSRGLLEKDVWACELALVEACNNAVEHTPLQNYTRPIQVDISCDQKGVELRIEDYTAGFEWPDKVELPSEDEERGRGLFLVKSLMDQVRYIRRESSNCLVLKKNLTGI